MDSSGVVAPSEVSCEVSELRELQEAIKLCSECIETAIKEAEGGTPVEAAAERLSFLLRHYCERPRLLEPHMQALLSPLLTSVSAKPYACPPTRAALLYMYHVLRVRRYKQAIVHLPHEISDLVPVLTFLESENPEDRDNWSSRFILLLWLSIIVMMPFHMSRLDGFTSGEKDCKGGERKTTMSRIYDICKTYSLVTDACAEAGAFLTSKFLTRSDVIEVYLGDFFKWACKQNTDLREEDNINYGVLASVATILKHGKREDLLTFADDLFKWIISQNYSKSKAILVRKYGVKIIQRIGLILLKPRLATWRYIRKKSSLALNLQAGSNSKNDNDEEFELEVNDEDVDIPELIEDVIEQLLLGLRDGDNIVRWSAAKGLGRVAARLNSSATGDIVNGLMELFSPHEGDGAWHGGCLALAELGRRGLLLPQYLPDAVKVVLLALQFEEFRGHSPTGQHVRDAACYVCWAFARAYSEDLNPFINDLLIGLMSTALFDREINCRMAGKAAFEEIVGRCCDSHGKNVVILSSEDFYLGPRNSAFLRAAPFVAKTKMYTEPLIDHLVEKKLNHWDINIREISSKSLHLLTRLAPEYTAEHMLPTLTEKTLSSDLNSRHGSILGIGEIINALHLHSHVKVSVEILEAIKSVVPILNSRYQFRGLGGELMRQACCVCIENLSLAKVKYHGDNIIDDWLNLIEECLSHEAIVIRNKAVSALTAVFNEYLNYDSVKIALSHSVENKNMKENLQSKRKELIEKYCKQLKNTSSYGLNTRMGYSLAIGALPSFVLREYLPLTISSLIECAQISEPSLKWAESRRDAMKGLTNLCQTVGIKNMENVKISKQLYSICNWDENKNCVYDVFECFIHGLSEYTIEMRGDIGAWVRETSMAGLLSLCKQCANENLSIFTPDLVKRIMTGIAQQSVEKIDRTRAHAGKTFTSLLYCTPTIPHIPQHSELLNIFPNLSDNNDNVSPDEDFNQKVPNISKNSAIVLDVPGEVLQYKPTVLWLFPEHTMPLFIKLLEWDVYRYNIILGLTVSGGDMTESLVKHSTSALFSYLASLHDNTSRMLAICQTIIQVFENNHGVDRVIIPMFKFLDRLLSSGCINPVLEDQNCRFANDILNIVKIEIKNCRNIYKLLDGISVLCQLTQVGGDVCRKALAKLTICICHNDKYIRKATATKLYDALLIFGDSTTIPSENFDEAMSQLGETNWEMEVAELKPIRNSLCDLFGIPPPIVVKKVDKP